MEATRVLADLEAAGAVLAVEGRRLRVMAPAGVMTPVRREAIKRERDELIALLVAQNEAHALERLDDVLGPVVAEQVAARRCGEASAGSGALDYVPPGECIGPRVCRHLGPCERYAAGQPCRVAS